MELLSERFGMGRDSTLSELLIDGLHECFILEDERREEKVPGETCIPPGRYEIKLRAEGPTHEKYAHRFPGLHQGMLWLQEVPDFQWVYIHIGNDDDDTAGCLLPGGYPFILPDGEFKVSSSSDAYRLLYRRVLEAMDAGERVFITITERGPQ